MIHDETRFRVARIPLSDIVITTVEPRYEKRILEYLARLRKSARDHVIIAVGVKTTCADGSTLYYVQDGRHRFLASLIAGRADVRALIHYEPGDAGYERALSPERLCALSLDDALDDSALDDAVAHVVTIPAA